jgi:hypothetical protein
MVLARIALVRDDEEVRVAACRHRLRHLGRHQFRGNHVLDADVVVGPLRDELVLDLDGFEAGRLAHADGAVHVHGIAVAAGTVQDQGQRRDSVNVQRGLAHLRHVEIGLEGDLLVAGGAAPEIAGGETHRLHHLGHQRVQDEGRGDGEPFLHQRAKRHRAPHRKTMVQGLPAFTTWPVGTSLPVAWSTRKVTMVSLSWFAA